MSEYDPNDDPVLQNLNSSRQHGDGKIWAIVIAIMIVFGAAIGVVVWYGQKGDREIVTQPASAELQQSTADSGVQSEESTAPEQQ